MKLTFRNVALGFALCGLASCANEAPWGGSSGKGAIDLKLTADADVKDALPSVRAGAPELVAPDVADFSIEMRNLDTDQVQTWRTLEEFSTHSQDQGFDVGSYTLTAFYGNVNECGFDKPYFMGSSTVNVLEGRESSVDVTAQLANVMLSIYYTDAFREYFSDYSVTAHTDGHANVVFGRYESRAGFLTPGNVTLQVQLTNPSGKSVTITPAEFQAVARHHYHVTFDVNADPFGSATLTVVFDDSTTKEDVTFTLSDELYNAEAPVVGAEGFTSGMTYEALAGNSAPGPLKFETICKGGLKSAVLKIAQVGGTTQFAPPFDLELDLMKADESTQYQLEQYGIKAPGLFKNPDQMAIVDVTDLPKYLPAGTFEITFTVTDQIGRENETPVVLNLSTLPINLDVTGGSAVYQYSDPNSSIPTVEATVLVTYNGLNPMECITFKSKSEYNGFKDCVNVDVKEAAGTRGFPDKTYVFNIKVCDVENSPLPMKVYFNGKEYADFSIDIIEPEYRLVGDAFATYARFKVETGNASDIPTIVNGMRLYQDGSAVSSSHIDLDVENGMLTLRDLTPDTEYTIGYSLTERAGGVLESQTLKIRTEAAAQIPNGDFSQTTSLEINNLQVGGQYRTSAAGIYRNYASIKRDVPSLWATINPKTCKEDAANMNTWFVVPSTYVENGRAIIRNVGYSHNGTTPAQTGNLANITYYNTNAATFSDSEKVSGELFLGSYSFSTQENRKNGIDFASRPKSLSFDYTYAGLYGDTAWVEVQILDASGNTIASGSSELSDEETATKVAITFASYDFGCRATQIRLLFKSSTNPIAPINIPSGGALNDGAPSRGYTFPDPNHYNAVATGSVLTIDNVKLNY